MGADMLDALGIEQCQACDGIVKEDYAGAGFKYLGMVDCECYDMSVGQYDDEVVDNE